MAKACYVCKKELGTFAVKWSYKSMLYNRTPLPDGMSEDDVVCKSCYEEIEKTNKEEIKEAKIEQSEHTKQLLARTPDYKKQWDKNGVIQFKKERDILQNKIQLNFDQLIYEINKQLDFNSFDSHLSLASHHFLDGKISEGLSELSTEPYSMLDESTKMNIVRLNKGELVMIHPAFRHPIKIGFPKATFKEPY